MPRRLLILNGLLLVLAAAFVASTVWTLGGRGTPAPPPEPEGVASIERSTPPGSPTTPAPAPGSYSVIVSRSLFSPTRSDEPATPAGAAPSPPGSKPFLFGVVLEAGTGVAYLQDPATKRVAAYRVGDQIAGATVKTIAADHVVLVRPDGQIDVRLHDPTKPRPAPTAVQAPTPQPAVVPRPGLPGVPVPPLVTGPTTPGVQVPQPVPLVPRRALPPNLLRQFRPPTPQGPTGETTR